MDKANLGNFGELKGNNSQSYENLLA